MAKAKSSATILVASSSGRMVQLQDERFVLGNWPIQFEISKEQADTWLRYFNAECQQRGWSHGSIAQLEARENSGSVTVNTDTGAPGFALVWDRPLDGPMNARVRPLEGSVFTLTHVQEFIARVDERVRVRATEQFYRRGQLQYDGLAWRGELWLDETIRLGPPSLQYDNALLGPRIIIVDALVDGADMLDASHAFQQDLREISAFLSAVMGVRVGIPEHGKSGCIRRI